MNAIFTRTSVRSYEERLVEAEKIERILKAAMAAPSAMNQQPWEFYIVTNKDVRKKLSGVSPYAKMTATAPVAIVVCGHKDGLAVPKLVDVDLSLRRKIFSPMDTSLLQNQRPSSVASGIVPAHI